MKFSEVFVLGDVAVPFFSFRLMHIVVHIFLEGTQNRMVLLLVRAVEEVEKDRHPMTKMIHEVQKFLVVVAEIHLQPVEQPVF